MAKKAKKRFILYPRYFKFGLASLFTAGTFLAVTLLTTVNFFKVFVVGFFMLLGIIDLTLYYLFRER